VTTVSVLEVEPPGEVTVQEVMSRGRGRTALALLGPAFVASVAYVDPGNFATNFAGGAEHGYRLVWVVVMANLMAILIQYLTSKAGLAIGQSLPELCRQRYGRRVNIVLWLQAEVVAMATDLAEFVGAALGLGRPGRVRRRGPRGVVARSGLLLGGFGRCRHSAVRAEWVTRPWTYAGPARGRRGRACARAATGVAAPWAASATPAPNLIATAPKTPAMST
jgi:hypothetical protein